MTGKAVARAVRGHFLVDTALYTLINFRTVWSRHFIANTGGPIIECDEMKRLYNELQNGEVTLDEICQNDTLIQLNTKITVLRNGLEGNRTAKLWFQYMDMISILQQFIRAERTGSWKLHLTSLRKMLPYFAASGHNLYLKSAYTYLQNMQLLEKRHPDVYKSSSQELTLSDERTDIGQACHLT